VAMFGWFRKTRPKLETLEEDLEQTLRTAVMAGLSKHEGLVPHYRPDVRSEEDFEARSAELPLVVVWGEHDTPEGLAFSMSINKHLVEAMVQKFVAREEPWFLPARNKVIEDLRTTSFAAMMRTIEATGAPPSAICQSLATDY
jgi:DNA repair exonuclease SbcCD nuclease subunit